MKLFKTKQMLIVVAAISLLSFGIAMAGTVKVVKQKSTKTLKENDLPRKDGLGWPR